MAVEVIPCRHALLARSLELRDLQHAVARCHKETFFLVGPQDGARLLGCLLRRAARAPDLVLLAAEERVGTRPRIETAHEVVDLLGRLCPVDVPRLLRQHRRVIRLTRLRDALERASRERFERLDEHLGAELHEAVVDLLERRVRANRESTFPLSTTQA